MAVPNQPARAVARNTIAISFRSDAAAWANRTLAEVEEQVERNWLDYERPAIVLVGLLLVAMLLFAFQTFPPRLSLSSDWWLASSDLDRIEAMQAQRPTLTDEDLREVSTMQLRNVLDARKATRSSQQNWTRRTVFLGVPLSVVVVCIVILVATCYPRAVFLWGDEVKRYASTVERRKMIWAIIIGVTVIGVPASFFSEAISSWFPR